MSTDPTSDLISDRNNAWRKETPGHQGWRRTARPGDPNKFFMISADCHANEPNDLWHTRMDVKFHDRLPSFMFDEKVGASFQVTEGFRPMKLNNISFEGEDAERNGAGKTPEERLADHARDGVDAEIIFPNKGLAMWATPDAKFAQAMCCAWNDWAWETFGPYNNQLAPMACLATGDLEGAIAETKRCAKLGFRGISIPVKPVWGQSEVGHTNYNLPDFDPFWEVVQDCDMPITIHVGTGKDPRTARGNGGAVINYAAHALAPAIEPVANLCASGVFERFPGLRFATIEAGIGWIPWAIQALDEAYKKHHMFTRPKLKMLPSEYFKQHGFASYQEDAAGLDLAQKHDLVDNFLWANDYPHHEGSWPHSAAAIEREMNHFDDDERAKILGLNAAKLWKFEVPAHQRPGADLRH